MRSVTLLRCRRPHVFGCMVATVTTAQVVVFLATTVDALTVGYGCAVCATDNWTPSIDHDDVRFSLRSDSILEMVATNSFPNTMGTILAESASVRSMTLATMGPGTVVTAVAFGE